MGEHTLSFPAIIGPLNNPIYYKLEFQVNQRGPVLILKQTGFVHMVAYPSIPSLLVFEIHLKLILISESSSILCYWEAPK
ncbi:hypothetical protein OPQ81_000845 [Rhizoctonia solani]|nr:hypothetical protein OPQ81_000845 [Rhizoctonia solani]